MPRVKFVPFPGPGEPSLVLVSDSGAELSLYTEGERIVAFRPGEGALVIREEIGQDEFDLRLEHAAGVIGVPIPR